MIDCTRTSVRLTFNYSRVLKRKCILLFKFLRIRNTAKHAKWLTGCKQLFPLHLMFPFWDCWCCIWFYHLLKFVKVRRKSFWKALMWQSPMILFVLLAALLLWSVPQDRSRWENPPPRENESRNSQVAVVVRKEEAWSNHFFSSNRSWIVRALALSAFLL